MKNLTAFQKLLIATAILIAIVIVAINFEHYVQ
jgi:hypothetical protein